MSSGSRLLDLPAELRNRIHELALWHGQSGGKDEILIEAYKLRLHAMSGLKSLVGTANGVDFRLDSARSVILVLYMSRASTTRLHYIGLRCADQLHLLRSPNCANRDLTGISQLHFESFVGSAGGGH